MMHGPINIRFIEYSKKIRTGPLDRGEINGKIGRLYMEKLLTC